MRFLTTTVFVIMCSVLYRKCMFLSTSIRDKNAALTLNTDQTFFSDVLLKMHSNTQDVFALFFLIST